MGPADAEDHPWKLVFLGFGFATLAVWLASVSGFSQGGLLVVGFSSIAAIPFLIHLFDYEAQSPQLGGADPQLDTGSVSRATCLPSPCWECSLWA